jgi:hypothetical protein
MALDGTAQGPLWSMPSRRWHFLLKLAMHRQFTGGGSRVWAMSSMSNLKKRIGLELPLYRQFTGDAAAIWSCSFSRFVVVATSLVQRRCNGGAKNQTKSLAQPCPTSPIYRQCPCRFVALRERKIVSQVARKADQLEAVCVRFTADKSAVKLAMLLQVAEGTVWGPTRLAQHQQFHWL